MQDCPEYIVALLEHIELEMERLYWNRYQKEYDSPFRNTGERFKNKVFEVHAYDWADEPFYDYNFKSGLLEISWYKNLGRGTTIKTLLPPGTIIRQFNRCMESLGEEWVNEYPD